MTFTHLLESMNQVDLAWEVTITDDWMQGRTTYGGLSAALCLQAVQNQFSELPPLRSAQINFIGPAGGKVSIKASIMRQGKSVTFICAEMFGEQGLATHAVFSFGAARDSKLDNVFIPTPQVPSLEQSSDFFGNNPGPAFAKNFDCRMSLGEPPVSNSELSEFFIWARHKDQAANTMVALLAVADMPPPAVLPMFKEFAPFSSMTWAMNFTCDKLQTQDRWWLMTSAAEHAKDGYSSQDMKIWNTEGELIVTGRQNVALFY